MRKTTDLEFEEIIRKIEEKAAIIRDITHNLNLNDPIDKEIYYSHLYNHIEEFEGFSSYV